MRSRPAEDTPQRSETRASPGGAPRASSRVCVGRIVGVHGVRGEIVVRSFTSDPADVAAYGPLTVGDGGRALSLRLVGAKKGLLIARAEGVADRTAAEALAQQDLWVDRSALPSLAEDEVYHVDLIGLAAELLDSEGRRVPLGAVAAVHEYGAGTSLEITRAGDAPLLVPFTREAVPELDLEAGRLTIAPLPGLLDADDGAASGAGEAA